MEEGKRFRPDRGQASILTAIALLGSGVILSYLSFFYPPVGQIEESVLWYFAQTLIYAGSAFGLKAYVDQRLGKD